MPTTTDETWNLPESELTALHARYKQTKERRIGDRLLCILLKAEKHWPHQDIAAFLDVDVGTVTDWLRVYLEGGLDHL